MKMGSRKKIIFPLLVALLLTSVCDVSSQKSQQIAESYPKAKAATKAESEDFVIKKIMLGSDCIKAPSAADDVYGWQGDWISLGKKKWRVLAPETTDYNSAQENAAEKKKILLQRETAIEKSSLSDYSETDTLLTDLSAEEAKAVSASVKEGGDPLTGEKLFFLDGAEATNAAYGYDKNKSRISNLLNNGENWWLRSSSSAGKYKFVETDGTISEASETESKGIRPAMTLDTDRILFVSPTEGGYSSFDKRTELSKVPNYFGVVSGTTWELTLQGVDKDGKEVPSLDAAVSSGTLAPGKKVTLTHKAANILSGANQVTAALYTESDGILYYGKINGDVTATSSELTLPEEMKPGTYKLLVFGEAVNVEPDVINTDYATAVEVDEAIEFTIEPEYVMGTGDILFSEKVGASSYRNVKRDSCQIVEVDNAGIVPKIIDGKKKLSVPFTFTDTGSETPATQVSFLIVGDTAGGTSGSEEVLLHDQVWYTVPDGESDLTFTLPEWYENEKIYVFTEKVTSGTTDGYASDLVLLDYADVKWTENGGRDRIISIITEEETDARDKCSVTLYDGAANDTIFSAEDFVITNGSSSYTDVAEGFSVEAIDGQSQVQGARQVLLTVKVNKEVEARDRYYYLWWKKKPLGELRVIKRVISTRNLEKTYDAKAGGSQLTAEERQELPILSGTVNNAQIMFYTDNECTTLVGSKKDTVSGINDYGNMPPGAGKVGDEPLDAGTYYYRIEMYPSEKNKGYVTTTRTFTIHKASVTVTAADQTIEVGSNISQNPSVGLKKKYLDTRANYYVNSVVLTPTSLELNGKNNLIIPSDARIYCRKYWETASIDVTKNFDIVYEPGKLTVTEKAPIIATPTPKPDEIYAEDGEDYGKSPTEYSGDTGETNSTDSTVSTKKITKPGKPLIKSAKKIKKGKKISLCLKKKIKGAKGYQIVYAINKKFKKKKTKTIKSIKTTLSGISKKKTYYIKVRAYKLDSSGKKVYGKYSKVKRVK